MSRARALAGLLALSAPLLLAACASPPAPLPFISQKARAALPAGTDLRQVHRRDDGCYFIQSEDELTGYLTLVQDSSGALVCDDI